MSIGSASFLPGLKEDSPFLFKKSGGGDRPQQRCLPKKKEAEVRGEEVLHDDSNHTLPRRMRWYRDVITSNHRLFMITRYTIYLLYFIHVAFVAAQVILVSLEVDRYDLYVWLIALGSLSAWMILIVLNSIWMIVMGGRQYFAWHGRPVIILHGFQALLVFLFVKAYFISDTLIFEYYLLVVMGLYLFVREDIVLPITEEQKLAYAGYVSKDHKDHVKDWFKSARVDDPELYDAVTAPQTSEDLIESFESARIDLDISEDVPIREALKGQDLRASGPPGSNEFQERHDDLVLVIYKLSKLVSFAPKCCRGNAKMTSLQYRNLVRQHVMDVYYPENKVNNNRTLPLSSNETFLAMLRLSMIVPWSYVNSQLPMVIFGIVGPFTALWVGGMTNSIVEGDKASATLNFALFIIFLNVVVPLLEFWNVAATSTYASAMGNSIRKNMMHGVVNGGTEYGELNGDGAIMDAFSSQLAKFEFLAIGTFNYFWMCVAGFASAVYVAFDSYPFGAILFISLGPVVLSFTYFTDKAQLESNRQSALDAVFAGRLTSIVQCRPAIRACDASTWIQETSTELMKDVKKAHRSNFFSSSFVRVMFSVFTNIFSLFILIPLGYLTIEGYQPVGDFITIMMVITTLQTSINFLGQLQSDLALYGGALQTVQHFMDKSLMEKTSTLKSSRKTKELSSLSQQLKADELAFKYEGMDTNVLENLNLSFPKGAYVVLTGGSGSGKSTILNLLMRFRKPNIGIIKWDGTDISSVSLESFRKEVAVMFQDTMIYEATVRDNILFGQPETSGGVESAAKMAEIDSAIRALPNGYNTLIGGNSAVGMSGGQMQRICLARALYRKPSVLLLDEATSALDAMTEKGIIDTLCELRDKKNMTIVSVSHHPSTGVNADRIIVLDKGAIAEDGTYNELMSIKGGIFKGLADAQ